MVWEEEVECIVRCLSMVWFILGRWLELAGVAVLGTQVYPGRWWECSRLEHESEHECERFFLLCEMSG